jgi:PAS domain S-box-containing protein
MATSGRTKDQLMQEIRKLRREVSGAAKQAALLKEYKQTEAALRESEERYRRLFEDDLTGDYVVTPEGRLLACNPAFIATFNFGDRREALETSMVSLYPDAREHARFIGLLRLQKKLENFECMRRRRDGVLIHVVENAVAVFDAQGEIQHIRGYLYDNTAHKVAEQALREAEQRYRNLIEFVPDAVLVSDADTILFANPAAAQLFGAARPDELVGRRLLDLYHPDTHPSMTERTRQALQERIAGPPEHRKIVCLDSRILDVETAVAPISFDGKPCVLRVNRDITVRVLAEEALHRKDREISLQLKKIEKLNAALTTLLEHREQESQRQMESFRANLEKLILPYLENFQATRLDEDQRVLVEVMAANLTNIASSFARQLDSWKTKLTPTEIQVADLLRLGKRTKEIAVLLRVSPSAVAFHRSHIRARLGLTRKPMNLVSYLRTIAGAQSESPPPAPRRSMRRAVAGAKSA